MQTEEISVVKTCPCPFSGLIIGLVLESLKSAHRLHLQCMDWKSNNFAWDCSARFYQELNRFSSAACLCLQSIFAAEPIYWADQLVGKQDWQTGISWGRMNQKEMKDNLGLGIFHNQQMDSFVQLEGDKRRLETLSKCSRATRMK